MSSGEQTVTTILSEMEIQAIVQKVREELGDEMFEDALLIDIDPEGMARFMPMADMCQQTREKKGLTLHTAAKGIKARPGDLKDIESAEVCEIRASVLHRYLELLELNEWYGSWSHANASLATRWMAPDENSDPVSKASDSGQKKRTNYSRRPRRKGNRGK